MCAHTVETGDQQAAAKRRLDLGPAGLGGASLGFDKKAFTDEIKTELFGAVDKAFDKI